jgi:hypothetical protein
MFAGCLENAVSCGCVDSFCHAGVSYRLVCHVMLCYVMPCRGARLVCSVLICSVLFRSVMLCYAMQCRGARLVWMANWTLEELLLALPALWEDTPELRSLVHQRFREFGGVVRDVLANPQRSPQSHPNNLHGQAAHHSTTCVGAAVALAG